MREEEGEEFIPRSCSRICWMSGVAPAILSVLVSIVFESGMALCKILSK